MKKIQLTQKAESAHKEFDPVALSENVSMTVIRDVKDGNISIDFDFTKGEQNIGRANLNERTGRVFVNLNTDNLQRNTMREMIEAMASLMLDLVPETVTVQQGGAAE